MHKTILILNLDHFCFFYQGPGSAELCQPINNEKLVESIKCTFDRTGDADLENCATPNAATGLLKFFLQQLPEPPITESAAADLLNLIEGEQKPQISAYIKTSTRAQVILFSYCRVKCINFLLLFRKHRRLRAGDKKNIELYARGQ